MVTMVDELYDRQYQDSRRALNAALGSALGQFGHAVRNAFEVLVRIEYQAPWSARSTRARCN